MLHKSVNGDRPCRRLGIAAYKPTRTSKSVRPADVPDTTQKLGDIDPGSVSDLAIYRKSRIVAVEKPLQWPFELEFGHKQASTFGPSKQTRVCVALGEYEAVIATGGWYLVRFPRDHRPFRGSKTTRLTEE